MKRALVPLNSLLLLVSSPQLPAAMHRTATVRSCSSLRIPYGNNWKLYIRTCSIHRRSLVHHTVFTCYPACCSVALPQLLCSHAPSAVAQPPSHGRIRATNSGSTPSHALQQYVQSLLRKCPLPGYCVRDQGLPGPSDYLLASPGHPGTQQQRVAIADYLAGSGFQVTQCGMVWAAHSC